MGFRATLNFRKFKVAAWETVTWGETQNKQGGSKRASKPLHPC